MRSKLSVLLVHNYYQRAGGEDVVFETEKALLEQNGHEVVSFTAHNERLKVISPLQSAVTAVWSQQAHEPLSEMLRRTRPDVAHFHNTFLMISPAAYYACKEEGVPVVQTLHNFRLLCPAATFFRDGRICEDCLGKAVTWPGVIHACWRGSRAGTALVSTMLAVHRLLKTWQEQVDVYIALTEFARQKFIEGGLPAEKMMVKPNFVYPDPGPGGNERAYALFVSRLTVEKGVLTVLEAWERLSPLVPLKIVGEGPLSKEVQRVCQGKPHIDFLGAKPLPDVYSLMQKARFVIFPTLLYETFGRVVIESYAAATPVIASNIGSASTLVVNGSTGLHFIPGDPLDLARKVQWAWEHPREMAEMGRNARQEYEMKYTAEKNYQMLMQIYRKAMGR
jgi:glycosyltransferase involved in cell wall biosynthesis